MKNFLTILILSILFTSNAYAKIDKSYVKQIYEGCISDAKQNNDYNSNSKKFCKCYANQFNIKFNNDQLIKFLSKSDQAKAQIIQNEISPPCYPKSNTSQSSSGNLIILKNCWDTGWTLNNKKQYIDRYPKYYFEIDINKRSVVRNLFFSDKFHKRRKKLFDIVEPKHRKLEFDIITFTEDYVETNFVNDSWLASKGRVHPYRLKLRIALNKNLVEIEKWDTWDLNDIQKEKYIVECN